MSRRLVVRASLLALAVLFSTGPPGALPADASLAGRTQLQSPPDDDLGPDLDRETPPLPPAPDLQSTIPSPQTVTAGPASATVPGTISLRSLRRSKCVSVVVESSRPARVLATIFSGRRSIRVFGQKDVRFSRPDRRVVCIRVPRRAHTFNVRTPLSFALGYRLGDRPDPRPVSKRVAIRQIRLAP